MAADGGTVKIDITGDIADFLAAMEKAEGSAQKTGTAIGDIFKGVMASQLVTKGISMITNGIRAAANGAITLGRSVVSAYADYEQLAGGIETLFGEKNASIVQKYAENAFKTAGLSANAYMETVTSFSASLIQSLGGDTAQAADMADVAITDMSDNANKMGTDMASIQNAYQGFAKQNYTMLDNLKLGYGGTKTEMERLIKDAEGIDSTFKAARNANGELAMSFADIVQAIHIIQGPDGLGIAGATAAEATGTIEGSVKTLKASIENLLVGMGDPNANIGELFGNVTEALENVINNIMPVVQRVFNTVLPQLVDMVANALPSLMDGIMSAIPTIVQSLFGVLKNVVSQLAAKLPDLVKDLMKGLPAALRGILDMLPQLIDMAIELATNIITGLIEALPELVPMLVEGIVRIVPKIFDGVARAVANIGASIWDMLMGSPEDMTERVNQAFNNIDTSGIDPIVASVKGTIETDIDLSNDPAGTIIAAVDAIRETIKGIEGISDEDKTAIINAIMSGTGIDVVQAVFDSLGIDSSVATQITDAMAAINTAIEGLGLSEEAETHLYDMLADENTTKEDIEEYLTSLGIDPKVASDTAATLTDANSTIIEALSGLGFDMSDIAALIRGCKSDKKLVVAALQLLGLSDADIATVTASYDNAAGTIYGAAMGLYDTLEELFTDGLPDDEATISKAKAAVQTFVDDAQANVDAWYAEALADLDASGLSGAALEAARADVDAKYQSMTDSIQEAGDAAYEYIDTNAGKSAEACQEALTDLKGVLEQVGVIDAAISQTTEKAFGTSGAKKRKWAEEGSQDREIQLYALAYTQQEYDNAIAAAEEERDKAIELAWANSESEEEYQKAKAEAEAAYDAKVAEAEAQKKLHDNAILKGMLSNDPEIQSKIKDYQTLESDLQKLMEGAAELNWKDYAAGGFDFESWLESLGLEMDPAELEKALQLKPGQLQGFLENDAMQMSNTWGTELSSKASDALDTAYEDIVTGIADSETGTTIAAAVNEGWLEPAVDELGKYDYAGMIEDALDLEGGLEDTGENGGEALETGLSKKETAVYKAAWRLGMKIKAGVTDALEIGSPSKVMRELGDFAGQGLDIGLTESIGAAIDNMRNMVTGINMTPKMDLSTIQSQLNSINEAQNEGNIVLQLNGRELGRAAAPDMNTAVNGYTRQIAMGYGRG